jgi:type III restriction enzyme
MALHPNFPESPYTILDPAIRWFPADEALRGSTADKLMPPLVPQLRKQVKQWRDSGYVGATDTSTSLLNWWFKTLHLLPHSDGTMAEFQYYFAQREALETIIYLYDELLSRVVYGGSRGVLLHPEPILEDDAVQDLWQVMRGT